VDDDTALDIQVHDSTSLVKSSIVRLNLDTYVVVAHEYMAPSELSKLTLDELKARKKPTPDPLEVSKKKPLQTIPPVLSACRY
jgi:hypothetical protein